MPLLDGICELTLQARDLRALERFYVEAFGCEVIDRDGDRSIYVEDPEGNVVEVWDFFQQGDGAREGVEALA